MCAATKSIRIVNGVLHGPERYDDSVDGDRVCGDRVVGSSYRD
jgi:hypothetical protein